MEEILLAAKNLQSKGVKKVRDEEPTITLTHSAEELPPSCVRGGLA